jgi:hypothetical protein
MQPFFFYQVNRVGLHKVLQADWEVHNQLLYKFSETFLYSQRNTNKRTCQSTHNRYSFLLSTTCFGHILTIFRAYILESSVRLKMCSGP